MRRIKTLFLIFLFLLGGILIFSASPVMSGGISIWPGKLTITMPESYPEEEISYEIEVNNLNSYDINVSAKAENPGLDNLKEDYSFIPDLSWVSITPEEIHISSHESQFFTVIITIPEDEKPLRYDERWEVWMIVSEENDQSSSQGAFIVPQLASRFFINTPTAPSQAEMLQFLVLILLAIAGLITAALIFYKKKRKGIIHKDKQRFSIIKGRTRN